MKELDSILLYFEMIFLNIHKTNTVSIVGMNSHSKGNICNFLCIQIKPPYYGFYSDLEFIFPSLA